MSSCQAPGCSFFAPAGGKYCSSHFKQLATDEEKALAAETSRKREEEIQQAKDAWDAALMGPISDARAALIIAKDMPGFKVSLIEDEIINASKGDLNRLRRLAECEEIKFKNRLVFPALLLRLLNYSHSFDDPIFDEVLAHPTINPNTLDFEIMNNEIYNRWRDIRLLEKIISKGKVTKQLVDSAKYSIKPPHNVSSPSQVEIIKLVERYYKEHQARETHKLTPQKRSADGDEEEEQEKEGEEPREPTKEVSEESSQKKKTTTTATTSRKRGRKSSDK